MDIMITSKNNEKFFVDKNVITLGTNDCCNFKLDLSFDALLSIRYDFATGSYFIFNTFSNPNILFCSQQLKKLELGQFNRIAFKNSNEFLTIRVLKRISA